ncbi:MAG: class I SAM-dependent methyltransferase [Pseudomonadales bacterium]
MISIRDRAAIAPRPVRSAGSLDAAPAPMHHSPMDDVFEHNRAAWNRQARSGNCRWSEPVDAASIAAARRGDWQVILTPNRPVPRHWFGELGGARVLCLASGGGQQAPLLAAAGASVVSFDAADAQLARDAEVAAREGLDVATVRGDMADLGCFRDATFDLVFHPVSNVFTADVMPVWHECRRVLRNGGRLLAGFMNPDYYLFDHDALERGAAPVATFELPFADTTHLGEERLEARIAHGDPLEFSHSLDAQIGGQITAGFVIAGFYEDRWDPAATPLDRFMPTSMATLARC